MQSKESPLKVAVLISGRGSNLKALIDAKNQNNLPIEFVVVLSDKKSAPGLEFAKAADIPTEIVPRKAKERSKKEFAGQLVTTLKKYDPELVVLAGFMRILHEDFVAAFEHRIVNIHPSLLPAFPGLEPQQQALDSGVRFSGCTVHFVNNDMDAGPIIAQAVVPVLADDDKSTLAARILEKEHLLYPAVIAAIARGEVSVKTVENKEKVQIESLPSANEIMQNGISIKTNR